MPDHRADQQKNGFNKVHLHVKNTILDLHCPMLVLDETNMNCFDGVALWTTHLRTRQKVTQPNKKENLCHTAVVGPSPVDPAEVKNP